MSFRTGSTAVVTLAFVLAGCGSDGEPSGSAEERITVGVFSSSPSSLIDQMVVRMGFLEDEGIEAELLEIPSGPDLVSSLIGGSAQVVSGTPPIVYPLIQEGECVKYLAPGMGNMYNLIAHPDVDIPNADKGFPESVRDLQGKTIGVVARGSATEVWASAVLQDAGLDPTKDVTFIAVGGPATALPAFQQRQVDALLSYPPVTQMIEAEGIDYTVVADMVGGDPDTLDQVLQMGSLVTCDYAENNPDTVDAYCRAIDKAYTYLRDEANAEEMGVLMSEILSVDEKTGGEIWEDVKNSFPADTMTEELWNAQVEFVPTLEGNAPDFDASVVSDCG